MMSSMLIFASVEISKAISHTGADRVAFWTASGAFFLFAMTFGVIGWSQGKKSHPPGGIRK